MAQPVLVVDFGVSSTAAALVIGERAVLLREPITGATVWPSVLCVESGIYLAGSAAQRAALAAPRLVVDGPRRAVDTQTPLRIGESEFPPAAGLSAFLGSLRGEALRVSADRVHRLALTVPASYQPADRRRDLFIEAGEAAGFDEVELIEDGTATLLDAQLTAGAFPDGALVLVCDLGETWATSLLHLSDGACVQVAQEGTTAGRDVDAMLFDDLRTQARDWLEPLLAAPGDAGRRTHREAADLVRRLKHGLTDVSEVSGSFTEGVPPYRLTREWLARVAEPGLRWVAASCRSLLARAAAGPTGVVRPGSTLADVAAVVLVGGGALLPNADDIIGGGLNRPVIRPGNPELAVVRGGVRWVGAAASRRIASDHPKWRVEPLTWTVPGGRARLERWSVAEGEPYQRGAVVAQVRTPDERVFELTAVEDGTMVQHRARVGDVVGPTLTAMSKREASCLTGVPPAKRQQLSAVGEWLLTPDRRTLVECATSARHVKLWSIADGRQVGEFTPTLDGAAHQGRIFVNPGGRLSLVVWNPDGAFTVWDVQSGRQLAAFRDANAPLNVMVNEDEWRLTAEAEDGTSAGRYRRAVATVWDLATGQRLEKLTDDFRRRLAGYRRRSAVDGFTDHAFSPDGRLHAVPVRTHSGATAIALQESTSDTEVFRAEHPPSLRVRMAFSGDGRFLLANWESDQRSQVDVWEL